MLDLHRAIISRIAGAETQCLACIDAHTKARGLPAVWRLNVSAVVWDAWTAAPPVDRSVRLSESGVIALGGETVTQMPWRAVIQADVCAYCNGRGGTMDHIQPQARGGADNASNLTGACVRCNQQKGAMSLLAYLKIRQFRARRRRPEPRADGLATMGEIVTSKGVSVCHSV